MDFRLSGAKLVFCQVIIESVYFLALPLLPLMSKSRKKYYVVWEGREPGIYENWEECKAMIEGFLAAKYKSFQNKEEAELAFLNGHECYLSFSPGGEKRGRILFSLPEGVPADSICVDAACKGNPGILEYRGVFTANGKELFRQGPFPQGTVNIGEFLAIVHALAMLKKQGNTAQIFSDSITAIKWVKDKQIRTKLKRIGENAALFDLVDRAIRWLEHTKYSNKIRKWDTASWGEIPADFGRK